MAAQKTEIEELDESLGESINYIKSLESEVAEYKQVILVMGDDINKLTSEKEDSLANNTELQEENSKLVDSIGALKRENESLKKKSIVTNSSSPSKSDSPSGEWVGMKVNASAYTLVEHGDKLGGTGLTSVGAVPTAKRTIAVDPRVIPYGSLVQYNGVTYVAEDTGGMIKGNKVDIFMNTLSEAVNFGRKDIDILVKKSK